MANSQIALVGSESLLAREIREIAAGRLNLKLVAGVEEREGVPTAVAGEPTILAILNAASLSEARAVILAGSSDSSRKALDLLGDPPESAVIDLTYSAEERPDARLRAPLIEDGIDADAREAGVHVIAHPAAIALALFLRRVHTIHPVRRAVIQIFAPASEHGTEGVEELKEQTVSLLSFKPLPKAVFDSQLGFSLLARLGQEAPFAIEQSELRIERHLASLLAFAGDGEGVPMPSLRVIQAPVFHGYSFSAWVQFDDPPEMEILEDAMGTTGIEVAGADFDPPNNVAQAGQDGIAVGAITADRNDPLAAWFWFVADNLRLHADNAVAVARELA